MSEKIDPEFSEGDGYHESFLAGNAAMRAMEEREFALRVKMFALDMAVQALPTLSSSIDSEETKRRVLRRAADDFERYLKGE